MQGIYLQNWLFAPYPLNLQISTNYKNLYSYVKVVQYSFLIASGRLLELITMLTKVDKAI